MLKLAIALLSRAAFLAAIPTLARAQATPDSTKPKQRLDPLVVTERRNARPSALTLQSSGLPTAVTVIDHAQLERTNIGRDFGSMLRRVPGIMAHNIGQGNTGDSEKMRGFLSSTHGADVAVYIDGVPQNVPSAAINHGMNDMTWLTPDMIERIDVIKGPFSALYGDQGRSGALNIVTRSSAESSIRGELASYGTKRGAFVLANDLGSLRSLLVADEFNTDGYRANSDEKHGTVFLKEGVTQGSSIWALRGVYHKSRWNAAGFLNLNSLIEGTLQPTDRDPTAPPLWGDADRSSLVFTRDPAGGSTGFHLSAYGENYKRTRALGANTTDLNVQADDRRILGARAVHDIVLGGAAAIEIGAETRTDRGDAINRRWVTGSPTANYIFDQDLHLLTYGAFVQAQYKPIESLKLLGGARVDAFDYDINNRKLPSASLKYKQSVATPRAGVVWTPIRPLDLFANIGQGFRSPNQTEISPSGSLGPLGASGGTNFPDLKPPRVTSKDVGLNVAITQGLQLSTARYHTLNQSEIAQVSPGVFASVGNVIRDGWEAESRLFASQTLAVYASYGRIMQARILSAAPGAADRISVPKHTAKGGIDYGGPFGLQLNADASYISAVPYFAGSPLKLTYTRQYTRFDARASRDYRGVAVMTFATWQPVGFSAEAASAIGAGLLIDPRPKIEVGVGFRYRFTSSR
jgi:outer membrane receptor protein involved in Fe transport